MAAVIQSVAYHGARKVRQLALCWRVRIGSAIGLTRMYLRKRGGRSIPDRLAPLVTRAILGPPRQHCLPLHELTCLGAASAPRY
jgi:hypothetical protein